MKWSKNKPVKPGWYWYKGSRIYGSGIIKIRFSPPTFPDVLRGFGCSLTDKIFDDVIWSKKPIKPPRGVTL